MSKKRISHSIKIKYRLKNVFFYLTFGTHGNSFISKFAAGSTLDASLANDVIDSDELNDEAPDEDIIVVVSSSFDVDDPLVEPSSLAASESKADCLVKLYKIF